MLHDKGSFVIIFKTVIFFSNRNPNKQYHVMRYNSSFNVDFLKWTQVKMERENNQRQTNADEEMPK